MSSSSEDFSDGDSLASDEELQAAFASGQLKPGLNIEVGAEKEKINNTEGLTRACDSMYFKAAWVERLDLVNIPAPELETAMVAEGADVDDDFKKEMKFYRQAQSTALEGLSRLHKLGIPTKRPEDFFAQMAKSDDHMKRVREKLLEKKIGMERSEKAKKLRELRKYGKKVQQEVLLKRQKDKKEMLTAVKKYRKGQMSRLENLEDAIGSTSTKEKKSKKPSKTQDRKHLPNKKRQYKNERFGFGGQKKRSKQNTSQSSNDVSEFSSKIHSKGRSQKGGKKTPNSRPGRSKRQKQNRKN